MEPHIPQLNYFSTEVTIEFIGCLLLANSQDFEDGDIVNTKGRYVVQITIR